MCVGTFGGGRQSNLCTFLRAQCICMRHDEMIPRTCWCTSSTIWQRQPPRDQPMPRMRQPQPSKSRIATATDDGSTRGSDARHAGASQGPRAKVGYVPRITCRAALRCCLAGSDMWFRWPLSSPVLIRVRMALWVFAPHRLRAQQAPRVVTMASISSFCACITTVYSYHTYEVVTPTNF